MSQILALFLVLNLLLGIACVIGWAAARMLVWFDQRGYPVIVHIGFIIGIVNLGALALYIVARATNP